MIIIKVAIVGDSNSGISQEEAKELGITILPMPFYINETMFFEDVTMSQDEFYGCLERGAEVRTSQPAPADLLELWNKLLDEYEQIVHIPMSSGLSGSCGTAAMLAEDFGGRVQVVDNGRIAPTLRYAIFDAKNLADNGKSAAEIKDILEREKANQSIYIAMDTLKYLKKGGRITPVAAAMGTMLNVKPVLQINGGKLDAFAKARGKKAAKRIMLEAMKNDLAVKFCGADYRDFSFGVTYTHNKDEAEEWFHEVEREFPGADIVLDPLSLSVACHIGPGTLAVCFSKKVVL